MILEQVKEALLKKHREQVERTKKQATQFAITQELSKVFMFCPLFFFLYIYIYHCQYSFEIFQFVMQSFTPFEENLSTSYSCLCGQIAEVEIPNSLLEEQGRQMYAAKLIELQVSLL